jgi:hypothetical protein
MVSATHVLLLARELDDALVDRAFGDEAVDGDLLGLAESVDTVHRLRIIRRVPVVVVCEAMKGMVSVTPCGSKGSERTHRR